MSWNVGKSRLLDVILVGPNSKLQENFALYLNNFIKYHDHYTGCLSISNFVVEVFVQTFPIFLLSGFDILLVNTICKNTISKNFELYAILCSMKYFIRPTNWLAVHPLSFMLLSDCPFRRPSRAPFDITCTEWWLCLSGTA